MNNDLFDAVPDHPEGPLLTTIGRRKYYLVPRCGRLGINWEENDREGVIGGLYDDAEDALATINEVAGRK